MTSTKVAKRYAKSLLNFAIEQNALEEVFANMEYLQALCKQSREFENMLRSPVIKAEKKWSIVQAVTAKHTGAITQAFLKLIIVKAREQALPEIINEFINQYDQLKDIHTVSLTTAVEISENLKQEIIQKVQAETHFKQVKLQTKVQPKLIGGFVLNYDNKLVDASILRDLKDIRKQFEKNLYEPEIR